MSLSCHPTFFQVTAAVDQRIAENLRRLMADAGQGIAQLAVAAGVDERTIKHLLKGSICKPHARTLHRLAQGLGVSVDELFRQPGLGSRQRFDRQTNPLVEQVLQEHPTLAADWTSADFDELYSQFGTGGQLTAEGAIAAAHAINRKRKVFDQVALLLETGEGELLMQMVDILYGRITMPAPAAAPPQPAAAAAPEN